MEDQIYIYHVEMCKVFSHPKRLETALFQPCRSWLEMISDSDKLVTLSCERLASSYGM